MDPFSMMMAGTALVGIGVQLFGSKGASDTSAQIAGVQQRIQGVEKQESYQKYLAALYTNRRQQMENLRRVQQARSASLAAGVSQGAQYGSGVKGGEAGVSAEGEYNTLGLSLGRQTTTAMYGLTSAQSDLNSQYFSLTGKLASDQGLMQLGQGITGAAGPLARLSGEAYGGMKQGFGGGTGGLY